MSKSNSTEHRRDVELEIASYDRRTIELEQELRSVETKRSMAQYELNRLRREAGEIP